MATLFDYFDFNQMRKKSFQICPAQISIFAWHFIRNSDIWTLTTNGESFQIYTIAYQRVREKAMNILMRQPIDYTQTHKQGISSFGLSISFDVETISFRFDVAQSNTFPRNINSLVSFIRN